MSENENPDADGDGTCDRPYMLRVMLTLDEKKQLFEAANNSRIFNGGKKNSLSHIARQAISKACRDINIRAKKVQAGV